MGGAEGRISPSAARALSPIETTDLKALALALPESWGVFLEPPHGQVAIAPLSGRHHFHRCWMAARRFGKITRDNGLT
jgi:hypothetical protein